MELEKKLKDYLEKNYNVTVNISRDNIITTYTIRFTITGDEVSLQVDNMYQDDLNYEGVLFHLINSINKIWSDKLRKVQE